MSSRVIEELNRAIADTKNLSNRGDDALLSSFVIELQRYKALAENHWPLTVSEKVTVDIGRVAVRELDDSHPEYVTRLCRLGAMLREEA